MNITWILLSKVMSWDAYVSKLQKDGCTFAAIVGLEGTVWASNFKLSFEEINALVNLATKDADACHGLRLGGWDYTVVSVEKFDNVRLKRKHCEAEEKYFVYCGVTRSAIVIGGVPAGGQERNIAVVVSEMQDYLLRSDF